MIDPMQTILAPPTLPVNLVSLFYPALAAAHPVKYTMHSDHLIGIAGCFWLTLTG